MDQLAQQFAALAQQYGPKVANAAMEAARVEAYSCLMSSLLWLAPAGGLFLLARMVLRTIPPVEQRVPLDMSQEKTALGYVLFAFSFLCLLPAIWQVIDPWTWTAIFHPELWIAKRAFGL